MAQRQLQAKNLGNYPQRDEMSSAAGSGIEFFAVSVKKALRQRHSRL
jgi:hypothetical protein